MYMQDRRHLAALGLCGGRHDDRHGRGAALSADFCGWIRRLEECC